jgi:7-cyano-7-deazaguanine synthase
LSSKTKVIAVLSGGLDSTTMVYALLDQGYSVDCVSFNYGQRHKKELDFAKSTAYDLDLQHDIVDLSSLGELLAGKSSLVTDVIPVPEGHYAEDTMKATVVPNRNMIMLSIAGGIGVARSALHVATGVHAGDHAVYPDCRPEFISTASMALYMGNKGFGAEQGISILAPFITTDKTQIAKTAILLGVPIERTWSCYKGGEKHCGRCGTCVERLESINLAVGQLLEEGNPLGDIFEDLTEYEDDEFWLREVQRKAGV